MTVELKTFISNGVLWSFIEHTVYKSKALWFSHSYEQPHYVTITCASQITSNLNICSCLQQRNHGPHYWTVGRFPSQNASDAESISM